MLHKKTDAAAHVRRLLQRAALAGPEAGLDAWRAWRSHVHSRQLDPASQWWFPLVWWNLKDAPIDDADRGWLRQEYQAAWLRNQHHLAVAAATVDALEREGIETLLLKGAALALTTYERVGLRPFGDVDVLVPTAAADAARGVLHRRGWTPIRHVADSSLALRHSLGYTDGKGVDFDLHWVSLSDCGGDGESDRGFWQRAAPAQMLGTATRVLSPADQLLHLCVHGTHWTKVPTGHWQADAVTVMRRAGDALSWDTLVAEARDRQVSLQMARAFDALRKDHDAPVPDGALRALRQAPRAWWERAEHRAKQQEPSTAPLVIQAWCAAARRRSRDGGGRFVDDLRAMTGTTRAWQLLPLGAAKTFRHPARTTSAFDAFGLRIQVEAEGAARHIIDPILGRLPAFDRARPAMPADRVYDVACLQHDETAPEYYRVTVDERPLASAGTIEGAADHIVADLQTFLVLTAPGVAFVHAGVVALGGRVIVVPGASRSGKSTLVAALLRAGATYLSDEFAVLGAGGLIAPYARPLVLRAEGGERRVEPGAFGATTAHAPLPADTVLFTQYSPDGVFAPEPLSSGDAILRLLAHCPGAQTRPVETLALLRGLMNGARAWTTRRGDADGAAQALAGGACAHHNVIPTSS